MVEPSLVGMLASMGCPAPPHRGSRWEKLRQSSDVGLVDQDKVGVMVLLDLLSAIGLCVDGSDLMIAIPLHSIKN